MPDIPLDTYLNPAPRTPRRGTKLSSDQIASTLRAAGWDERHISTMTAIAQAESSGNPDAHNAKYPDDSYGLLQVNRLAHPQYSPETLRDPLGNAKAALDVFKKQGLRAWSTYTNGAYRNHLSQRTSPPPQKPTSDLGPYLDPQPSGQTPPPETSPEQRQQPPSTPVTPASATSVPSLTDALDQITASVNLATKTMEGQATRQPISRPVNPLFQQLGQQRTVEQEQRAQEDEARRQVREERLARATPAGRPNLTGALHYLSDIPGAITSLFHSDEENFNSEVAERLKQMRLAEDPEVIKQRKEFGATPAYMRPVTAALARGAAGVESELGGLVELGGLLPKGVIPPLDQVSRWLKRRSEIVEAGASNAPLREKRNLGSLITGQPELEEVQRGLPEKVATGLADLGLGIAQIVALKKATRLSLPSLLALEAGLKSSDKPVAKQVADAAQGYALGKVLDSHLSRGASAAVFGLPTAVQTGEQVAQGRMSPLDAAIQTGVQAGAGAVLGGGRRAETPTQARLADLAADTGPRDEVSTASNPLRAFRRPYGREGEVRAITPRPPRNEIQGRDLNPTEFLRVIQAERKPRGPQTEVQSPVAAKREAVERPSQPSSSQAVEKATEVADQMAREYQQSAKEVPARFYHRDFGEVSESLNQKQVGKRRVRVVAEDGSEHVIKRASLTGAGNQRAVPIREPEPTGESAQPAIDQYLEPQGQPTVEPAQSPATESPSSLQQKGELTRRVRQPKEVAGGPLSETVTEPVTKSPSTAPKNAAMAADRAELGLPEPGRVKGTSAERVLADAKQANATDPRRPDVLVEQALRGGRNFTDTETMQVNLRAAEIKNRVAELQREIADARDDATIADKGAELDTLINEFDRLSQAQRKAGTAWGRAGIARQRAIDEDYSLVSMIARFRKDARRVETPSERAQIEQLHARNAELETKLAEAESRRVDGRLQDDINRTARRQRRAKSTATLNDEFAQLQTQFAQARAEVRNVQPSGLAGLDPEGKLTKLIAKMARNRVDAGVNKAETLVDEIYEAIKDHLPASVGKRDVRDAISGYSIGPKTTRSEIQKQVDTLKSELHALSKGEDIEAGVRSPHREGPKESEAQRLPMEGPRLSDERSSGIPRQGPRRSDIRQVPQQGPRMSEARQSGVPLQGPKLSDVDKVPAPGPRKSEARSSGQPLHGPHRSDARKLPAEGPKITDAPPVGPRLSDIRRVPEQGPKLSDANKLKVEGPQMVEHGPPKAPFSRDLARQRAIAKEIADLDRRLATSDFSDKAQREPPRYTRETARLQRELEQNRAKYARMRYKATRSTGGKITDELVKAANVPKTLKSIGDVSAMFRQGGYYAITHPVAGLAKPTQAMLRSITDTGWRNVEAMIKADPAFEKLKQAGVEFTGVDKADPNLSHREEGYLGGEYLDYIPVAKQVKDFSERTFVSFLDAQRLHVGKTILDGMTEAQRANPAEVKAVARLINIATGRGELGKRGNQLAPALNIAMFSPRLLASRVQLLNNMLNPVTIARMPAGARKAMIADNVKFLAATGALLGLAKAAGATVSTDPDDAEFLKIRVGNTVYDTLTGLQQPLRYIANMARAASPVNIRPLQSGPDYYAGRNMAEMSKQFARSKLNPALAPAIDFISGQDFEGRKFSAGRELRDLAIPLPAKDVYEGLREGGIIGGLQATPTFVGVGVGSYPPAPDKPRTHAEKLARKLLREGMPPSEAREEEQIDTDREKAQLRARSRAGESVNAELVKLIREGKITDRQAKRVVQAKGRTRLSEDLKTLDPDESLRVYSVMNADERRVSAASIKQKIANSKADAAKKAKFRERARELGLVQ